MIGRPSILDRAGALVLLALMVAMSAASDFSLFHCRHAGTTHVARCCPAEREEPPESTLLATKCCDVERVVIDAPPSLSSSKVELLRPPAVFSPVDAPLIATGSIARIAQALEAREVIRPPPILLLKCVLLV